MVIHITYNHIYIISIGWAQEMSLLHIFQESTALIHCCCSVTQLCPTLSDPMAYSIPVFPIFHYLLKSAQMCVYSVGIFRIFYSMPSIHLILFCPLLLLPSILPSIRLFSNRSALCIRWPKNWSLSFSIGPSNEYSGLSLFRIDWLDLLAIQETLKSLLQHHSLKASVFRCSNFSERISSLTFSLLFSIFLQT